MSNPVLALDRSMRESDPFGRLRVELTNITKANVCPYLGREIPGWQTLGLDGDRVYKLWRHPDELKRAAHTFDMVPILDEHIVVDADNPERQAVAGTTGSGTRFEFPYLKTPMALWVGDSIEDVKTRRKRQLSCGYTYRPDMTPGVTTDGVAYDGVMRDIMGNHVAIVREGRAGPDVMVADEQPAEISEPIAMKRTSIVDVVLATLGLTAATDAQKGALDAALDGAISTLETQAADAATKAALDAKGKPVNAKEHGESCDCGAKGCGKAMDEPKAPESGAKKPDGAQDGKTLTQADVDAAVKAATDAAIKNTKDAERALAAARADVADIVGAVALDSAEAVYRYALKEQKVDGHETIHTSALPALWAQVKRGKTATGAAQDSKATATDAAALVSQIGF